MVDWVRGTSRRSQKDWWWSWIPSESTIPHWERQKRTGSESVSLAPTLHKSACHHTEVMMEKELQADYTKGQQKWDQSLHNYCPCTPPVLPTSDSQKQTNWDYLNKQPQLCTQLHILLLGLVKKSLHRFDHTFTHLLCLALCDDTLNGPKVILGGRTGFSAWVTHSYLFLGRVPVHIYDVWRCTVLHTHTHINNT